MTGKTEVVVIGGGYAGVMAANRLTQRDDVAVTLINPRPVFVHRIRLYQMVRGADTAVVAYRDVLAEDVRLVVDSAARIDAAGRTVTLAGGGTLGYAYLVYAAGSGSAAPRVPGAAESAYPVATLEEVRRLRPVLDAAPAAAPVTVVGGGATGIEVAAELAEDGRSVTLACGGVLGPDMHPRGRRSVARQLHRLGVKVLDGPGAKVTAVTGDAVTLADGRELPSEVTVWTTGFTAPDLAARSGLSTDAQGRLRTDETLTSVDDAHIVAAGDCAAPSDLPLRMSCQAAGPTGAHAADTVLSRIAGTPPAPLTVGFFGHCVAVGSRAATVQIAARDDTAKGLCIGGRLAATIKSSSFKGLLGHLSGEARKPGSFTWKFQDTGRPQRLRARHGGAPADSGRAARP
ncbi:NAD(P)/FAD-dependent oxidoreductase [Streptomyces sp. YIM 98790]|uniref:NAD(P)/FAD-dependent oxidoreductase n=1 Tax=Streptomyces sp. YIM 98790 TaxID=2689077 RepID=UPI0014086E18|nr:FAD-dependent oxidoreductase [Streptomyces sp. YIM 98790]